jgi:hypothetical protein
MVKLTDCPCFQVWVAVCDVRVGACGWTFAPILSAVTVSPAASSVLRLTSKVVSQYWPAAVPQGLRISSMPVVLS